MGRATLFAANQKEGQVMLDKIVPSAESSHSLAQTQRVIRCDACGSEQAAVCLVELRFLCVEHFVAYCYERLADCEKILSESQRLDSRRSFLRECATEAAKLLLIGRGLQNIDRARLFDVVLWSNELFYRLMAKSKTNAGEMFPAADNSASLC